MNSADKDLRYMATNDLLAELRKDHFSMEEPLERKVVAHMLRLLEDKSGEVQSLVAKGSATQPRLLSPCAPTLKACVRVREREQAGTAVTARAGRATGRGAGRPAPWPDRCRRRP
jgi:hypothetical protein